jgi:PAT family beta-lactamase induction signal transducer AmpG
MPRVVIFVIVLLLLRQKGVGLSACLCGMSAMYLPWVLKVWWKPLVGQAMSYRLWILLTQFLLAALFGLLAFSLSVSWFMWGLLVLISWLTALHNVAADEYSRSHPLAPHHSIIQELFRKFALVIGQGVLLVLAGNLQIFYRYDMFYAWQVLFFFLSGFFMLLFFWHVWTLPSVCSSNEDDETSRPRKLRGCYRGVFFLLFYAFAQAMAGKAGILFLIDTFRNGGVGLSPQEFGFVMGIVGIVALTVGGFLGRKAIRRFGLNRCLMPMTLCMLIPCVVYVALSYWQPHSLLVVGLCILAEQLTYGFGFSVYLSYLKRIENREAGKSLMAFSMLSGCLVSGLLLQSLGYNAFFVLSLSLSLLSIFSSLILKKEIRIS